MSATFFLKAKRPRCFPLREECRFSLKWVSTVALKVPSLSTVSSLTFRNYHWYFWALVDIVWIEAATDMDKSSQRFQNQLTEDLLTPNWFGLSSLALFHSVKKACNWPILEWKEFSIRTWTRENVQQDDKKWSKETFEIRLKWSHVNLVPWCSGYGMRTHKTGVFSSLLPFITIETPSVRMAAGNHLIKLTSLEKITLMPVCGFCYAWNKCVAIYIFMQKYTHFNTNTHILWDTHKHTSIHKYSICKYKHEYIWERG